VKRKYHVVESRSKEANEVLRSFCAANGQILLPLVDLIAEARLAVDEVIDQAGRGLIETIFLVSAEQVAGAKTPGKSSGDVRWHGRQKGRVRVADRQVQVERPRLRRKQGGEVAVPAYDALRHGDEASTAMFEALLRGVSTREYADVIPGMAESVGVSRSAVSREAAEAGERMLKQLLERRWDKTDLLVLYLDGMRFGTHHVINAVGVDRTGRKHVLGLQLGATENAAAIKDLLVRLREQGLPTDRRYLFVVDGAKALRAAIAEVFGSDQLVQRCRTHKLRNVLDRLPKQDEMLVSQTRSLMREETFTINRADVPPSLHRCLSTTNIIESPQAGVRKRTGNVSRWRDPAMVERWVAGALLMTEADLLGRSTPSAATPKENAA